MKGIQDNHECSSRSKVISMDIVSDKYNPRKEASELSSTNGDINTFHNTKEGINFKTLMPDEILYRVSDEEGKERYYRTRVLTKNY